MIQFPAYEDNSSEQGVRVLWDFGAIAHPERHCHRDARSVGIGLPVRVNELVRKCIVFLGILDDAGAFAPYGTGFNVVYQWEGLYCTYLVSAKHVIEDIARSGRPPVARMNGIDGTAKIGTLENTGWFAHPTIANCDVVVCPFGASRETFDFKNVELWHALTPEYITENDIGCGDEVFTAGLLVSHFGRNKNVPVIRTGTIAVMPDEHVDLGGKLGVQDVYLIESRSIGGLSGSPVFLNTPPHRIIGGNVVEMGGHQRDYIIGVNIGLFETKAHGDKLRTDTLDRREHFLETMSAGIAVVVPIQRAIEIIENEPHLVEGRKMGGIRADKHPNFVPSSATAVTRDATSEPPLPANDVNPTHREDFTRLVGAAARKPPQAD